MKTTTVENIKKEILDAIILGKVEIKDFSINKECSKCGECCSNFLPVSQKEVEIIEDYVIKNNIKPQTQVLVMQNRLTCPYYNDKCLIYEVRPLICKEFYCYKEITIEKARKFEKEQRINVDMWEIAKEIEKERKKRINDNS